MKQFDIRYSAANIQIFYHAPPGGRKIPGKCEGTLRRKLKNQIFNKSRHLLRFIIIQKIQFIQKDNDI